MRGWLQIRSLSDNGVRGSEIVLGFTKFVFYTVKAKRKIFRLEPLSDDGDLGLMITLPGRAFVLYVEHGRPRPGRRW